MDSANRIKKLESSLEINKDIIAMKDGIISMLNGDVVRLSEAFKSFWSPIEFAPKNEGRFLASLDYVDPQQNEKHHISICEFVGGSLVAIGDLPEGANVSQFSYYAPLPKSPHTMVRTIRTRDIKKEQEDWYASAVTDLPEIGEPS